MIDACGPIVAQGLVDFDLRMAGEGGRIVPKSVDALTMSSFRLECPVK